MAALSAMPAKKAKLNLIAAGQPATYANLATSPTLSHRLTARSARSESTSPTMVRLNAKTVRRGASNRSPAPPTALTALQEPTHQWRPSRPVSYAQLVGSKPRTVRWIATHANKASSKAFQDKPPAITVQRVKRKL